MASSDLVNMGISVVSYTLKDVHDDQVRSLKTHTGLSELGPLVLNLLSDDVNSPDDETVESRIISIPWGRLGRLRSRKTLVSERPRTRGTLSSG